MVRNAAGQPVIAPAGQAVGPTARHKVTNDAGCAVFDESEAGSYKLEAQPDRLGRSGRQAARREGRRPCPRATSPPSSSSTTARRSFTVVVKTHRPGVTTRPRSSTIARAASSRPTRASARSPGRSTAALPGSASFTLQLDVPVRDAVQGLQRHVHRQRPVEASWNYFAASRTSTPGPPAAPEIADARAGHRRDGQVHERLERDAPVSGATVYAYPKTAGCASARITLGTTDSTGRVPAGTGAGPGPAVRHVRRLRPVLRDAGGIGTRAGSTNSTATPTGTPVAADHQVQRHARRACPS